MMRAKTANECSCSMFVADNMSRDVLAVAPDSSLRTVARLFAVHDISGVPVIDARARVVGVVSKGDLVAAPERPPSEVVPRHIYYRLWQGEVTAEGTADEAPAPPGGVAADVMSPTVLTIDGESTVIEAARIMVREKVHRLVVTGGGRVQGIITALDCLWAIVGVLDRRTH
jgi:CBS domain-containing protein